MQKQNYELKNEKIKTAFLDLKKNHPEKLTTPLNLSWSNWGFGIETLAETAARLNKAGLKFIELHGNHYGPDLGYSVGETLQILADYDIRVGGICGMFSADNDLSSNRAVHRQAAVDYIKREIDFTAAVGGSYILVVPGAVGRPQAYDDTEFERSVDTLRRVADLFVEHNINVANGIGTENIVQFAEENDADLIIVGVRRRSKVGKLMFGSTAQFVILKASCPVMTVK